MGRNSKLTEMDWRDVYKRIDAGQSVRAIARRYKISETAIRLHVRMNSAEINSAACKMVEAEQAVTALSLSDQSKVQKLVLQMLKIQGSMAAAAVYSAASAERLAALTHQEVVRISRNNPLENMDQLRGVGALSVLTNQAANIPMRLMAAAARDSESSEQGATLVDPNPDV